MTRTVSALLLLGSLAVLPACRSDGGFGRRDSVQSRRDLGHFLAKRFDESVSRTADNLAGWDEAIGGEFHRGTSRIQSTWALYVGDYSEYYRLRVTEPSKTPIMGNE